MILKTVTRILFIYIFTVSCNSHLAGIVNILERRLNQEIYARSHYVASIFSKLDEIQSQINESLICRDASGLQNGDTEMRYSSNYDKQAVPITLGDVKKLENNIQKLYRAFKEQKRINVETRNTLPEIRKQLTECDSRSIDIQKENNLLKIQQNEVRKDNLKLQGMAENSTENMANRFKEVQKQYDMLVSNNEYIQQKNPESQVYTSCKDALDSGKVISGVYSLIRKATGQLVDVYCDQTSRSGGWIVFQRRTDGSVNFDRGLNEYKNGFGNVEEEFWLGNDFVHELTRDREHELLIHLEDIEGNTAYAQYHTFKIHSEREKYQLELHVFPGTFPNNPFTKHNGSKFFTRDSDDDYMCAERYRSAWWYTRSLFCYTSNFNAKYTKDDLGLGTSLFWLETNVTQGLIFREMKIREKET